MSWIYPNSGQIGYYRFKLSGELSDRLTAEAGLAGAREMFAAAVA